MTIGFLHLNGVPIPVAKDSLRYDVEPYGDLEARAVGGTLLETRAGQKRVWSFSTTMLRLTEEALPLMRLIDGLGQGWAFDDVTYWRYSFAGIRDTNVTATVSRGTSAPAPFLGAGRLQVNASQFFTFPPRHRAGVSRKGATPALGGWEVTLGFTLHFARWDGAAWDFYTVTAGAGEPNRARASSANPPTWTQWENGVAGSYGLGYAINLEDAGNGVGLCGWSLANSAANQFYDQVVFWPFGIPATWRWPTTADTWAGGIWDVQGLGIAMPPYLRATGWGIEDWGFSPGYVDVRGLVKRVRQVGGKLPGASAFEPHNVVLDVELREV